MDRGFIKGKRAPFFYGNNRVWDFQEEDIIECIERRPWLAVLDRMEESYFRSIARREWQTNPWYTSETAAPLLGIVDHNAVKRYIRRGWLHAERKPGAGGLGEYVLRKKDINAFLQDDPRPGNKSAIASRNRKRSLLHLKQRMYRLRRKMRDTDWRGRGTMVKNCPGGRTTCHRQCPARKGDRCYLVSRIGSELRWLRPIKKRN